MTIDQSLLVDLSGEEVKGVKRLFERGVTIPPQPRVLIELQDALARGVADVRILSHIIAQDPSVAAALFKVVQSPAFRGFQPFTSLSRVLQAIGLQQTANILRAIAMTSSLPAKHNRKAFEAYWARSLAIAELAMLVADERVCRQILINLMSNAVKFTPEGGKVIIKATKTEGAVAISIQDTGIGIPSRDIEKLGRPFEQVENQFTKSKGGSGLGLAISKSFIELHNGSLGIRSAVGQGTEVTVKLPDRAA